MGLRLGVIFKVLCCLSCNMHISPHFITLEIKAKVSDTLLAIVTGWEAMVMWLSFPGLCDLRHGSSYFDHFKCALRVLHLSV